MLDVAFKAWLKIVVRRTFLNIVDHQHSPFFPSLGGVLMMPFQPRASWSTVPRYIVNRQSMCSVMEHSAHAVVRGLILCLGGGGLRPA